MMRDIAFGKRIPIWFVLVYFALFGVMIYIGIRVDLFFYVVSASVFLVGFIPIFIYIDFIRPDLLISADDKNIYVYNIKSKKVISFDEVYSFDINKATNRYGHQFSFGTLVITLKNNTIIKVRMISELKYSYDRIQNALSNYHRLKSQLDY